MQLQLRRRYTNGLSANVNYTLAKNTVGHLGRQRDAERTPTGRCATSRRTAARRPFDVRHVFQTFGTYDLPFGRDRRFNIENGVLNAHRRWLDARRRVHRAVRARRSGCRAAARRSTASDVGRRARERPHGRGDPEHDPDRRTPELVLRVSGSIRGSIGPDGRANPEYLDAADDAWRVRAVHRSCAARTCGTSTCR